MPNRPLEEIYATLPVDGGFDPVLDGLFDMRGGGTDSSTFFGDLDYMDRLEEARDQDFRMQGVVEDPTKEAKANITKDAYDALSRQRALIFESDKTDAEKRADISKLLSDARIPHDPESLDVYSPADRFGLLSNRINIIEEDDSSSPLSGGTLGGMGSSGGSSQTPEDFVEVPTETEDLSAEDPDLTGDVDQTVEDLASEGTVGIDDETFTDSNGVVWVFKGRHPVSGALIWQAQNPTAQDIAEAVRYSGSYTPIEEGGQGVRILTSEGEFPTAAEINGEGTTDTTSDADVTEDTTEATGETVEAGEDSSTIDIDGIAEGLLAILNRLPNYGPLQTPSDNNANENVQNTGDQGTGEQNTNDQGTGDQNTGDNELGDNELGDNELGDGGLGDGDGDGGDGDGGDGEIDVNVIPIPNLGGGGTAIDEGIRNTGTGNPSGGGGGALGGCPSMLNLDTPIANNLFSSEFTMDYLRPELLGLFDLNRGRTS